MQHLSLSPMPIMQVGDDGSVTVIKKHFDVDESQGEYLDPKDLPATVAVVNKDTTTNDWRKGFQGFFLPEKGEIPGFNEFMAVHCSERDAYNKQHEEAAKLEKLAHDNAMYNPINLAGQMYDLMAMYNKKMGY